MKIKNWEEYKGEIEYKGGRWAFNWFSNMIPVDIEIDGIVYKSVENYYQAMKMTNDEDKRYIAGLTPEQSKTKARKLPCRSDWDDVKIDVMRTALEKKFIGVPEWREKLLATGNEKIIEWNNWNDKFWGVSVKDNKGKNHLGLLLMEIRTILKTPSLFK